MFSSKNSIGDLFWIGFVICGIILGFGLKYTEKYQSNGLRTSIVSDKRQTLHRIYTAEIGVREPTGRNDGIRVQEYLQEVGLKGNYSYCAAFVSYTFSQAGMAEPRTAWSPALFPDKRVVWERGEKTNVMPGSGMLRLAPLAQKNVKMGDVFGLYFSELKRIAHCGFVDQWDGTWCITVEANTNSVGAVISENDLGNPIRAGPGEGVYRKKRLVRTIYKVADWMSIK
ncbi:hypothetical protein SAMN05216436_1328 [bacterium A37T11]|nr:hypothetical protein SAMN05216436_1328 [bacterium A37T11]